MANGYASNIPREEVAPPPALLSEEVCLVCKRRPAADAGLCRTCGKALAD